MYKERMGVNHGNKSVCLLEAMQCNPRVGVEG